MQRFADGHPFEFYRLKDYGQRIAVILRVISCKENVNSSFFKEFCISTNLILLEKFKWVSISKTLHKVLAHNWELIEKNDGKGLGRLDESGLEANNKLMRKVRQDLSRKNSQSNNIMDTLNRLWLGSDPVIIFERRRSQPFCNDCNVHGHSKRHCTRIRTGHNESDDILVQHFIDGQ